MSSSAMLISFPRVLDSYSVCDRIISAHTRLSRFSGRSRLTLAPHNHAGSGDARLVSIPAGIVEPLIAASICLYSQRENLFMNLLSQWRTLCHFLAFGPGLHGFGLRRVLTEIGLSQSHFVTGLISSMSASTGPTQRYLLCFLAVLLVPQQDWYELRCNSRSLTSSFR